MADYRHSRSAAGLILILFLLALAACGRKPAVSQLPDPTSAPVLPESNAAVLIHSDTGGVVGLRDGAELALPRQALTDSTLVTLRALSVVPPAPIPHSVIGRAYDVSLDGSELVGIGMLTLPLNPNVTPDQYDVGIYRWDGRQWQRVEGRFENGRCHLGIDRPGTYAILGAWRMADAAMTLAIAPGQTASDSVPAQVRGQYKYMALPTMQHDYIEARLVLKRDSTGGAGQVSGDEQLDQTIGETVLWFKPDPSQSQGVIEFDYTFGINPAALTVPLGSVNRFYATLSVIDSPAPTRRLSTAADYTVLLPIKAVGASVVRPDVPGDSQTLFWHVRLNGQTLFRKPATDPTLSLADVLAAGGLGEYKITLEIPYQDGYAAISNEVTVQLAVPGTMTPESLGEAPGSNPDSSPTPTVFPFGTMPATPTRRSPRGGTPSPLEGPTAATTAAAVGTGNVTPAPSLTPTPQDVTSSSIFWADASILAPGQCTNLHWNVQNVREVYLNDAPSTGVSGQQICPTSSTTYTLRVVDQRGRSQEWRVPISVQTSPSASAVDFGVDQFQIVSGKCTMLHWRATNVVGVYLNDQGVSGEATQNICPTGTTTYILRVVGAENTVERRLTVYVLPSDSVVIRFWADQYTLKPGSCTTIHWAVENVDEVHLKVGTEVGVAGDGAQQVCPSGAATYALRVLAGGHETIKNLTVQSADVELFDNEVIAQGMITDLTEVADINPNIGGDQNGFEVHLDSVTTLVRTSSDCCQTKLKLLLAKSLTGGQYANYVDWPLRIGQLVEFRLSPCNATQCSVYDPPVHFYLKSRSP